MHPNIEKLHTALSARGYRGKIVMFDGSTRTSAEAAAAIGTTVAQIAKSIIFTLGNAGVLVVASGTNRVSTTKVNAILGAEVRRADADAVKRLTGYPIGGVPPLGHATEMTILIDEDLLEFDEVWGAGGTPNAVFPIAPGDLVRMTEGEVADIREER